MADFELLKVVVLEALEYCDPLAREEFIKGACGSNAALRHEVASILEHKNTDVPLLSGPIFDMKKPSSRSLPAWLSSGARIGHYVIEEVIGRGGMAVVALATRDDDFKKRVAIKVVLPWMVSGEILTRFRNERQLLAGLDHLNIARVFDGGDTDDGSPYMVMEYVEGDTIATYCERVGATVRDKLRLVLQVCSALEHAHQKLVVHRDLKPANIYVDSGGNIKILDFGIAKSLDEDRSADLTWWPQAPMTLKYASPEQIAGGQLATTTDIYSVGVLMYELLTGEHPHAKGGMAAPCLARAICESHPRLPSSVAKNSSLRQTLVGDLDSIILRAMRKDPSRRYGSARELSEDIERFLAARPVLARAVSWPYRVSKFIDRNRVSLGVAALLAVFFVGLTGVVLLAWRSSMQEKEAVLSRQNEELAYEYARRGEALELIRGLFQAAARRQPQEIERTLAEILEHDEKDIEQEVEDPLLQADVIPTMTLILRNLGLYSSELEVVEAVEHEVRSQNGHNKRSLACALNNVGILFFQLDNYSKAEDLYRESLKLKTLLSNTEDVDSTKVMSNLATLLSRRGYYEEARSLYQKVVDVRTRKYGSGHPAVATSLRSLGSLYYTLGQHKEASTLFENQRLIGDIEYFAADYESSVADRITLRRREYRELAALLRASDAIRTASMSDAYPEFAARDAGRDRGYTYTIADVFSNNTGAPITEEIRFRLVNRARESLDLTGTRGLLGHYLFRMGGYVTESPLKGAALVDSHRERPVSCATAPLTSSR